MRNLSAFIFLLSSKPFFLLRLCQFEATALSQVSDVNVVVYTQMDANFLLI